MNWGTEAVSWRKGTLDGAIRDQAPVLYRFDPLTMLCVLNIWDLTLAWSTLLQFWDQGQSSALQSFTLRYIDYFSEFYHTTGDMTIFSTETWKSVRRIKGAHMVFTTDVAFSQDSKSFLSVSADSSLCTCSFPRRPPSFRMNVWILSTLVLLVALLAWPHAWPLMEEWVASQLWPIDDR